MDSAIRLAADSATKRAAENFRKVLEAEQAVRPLIGDVVAMDSADDVYRTALEQAGVDIEGVTLSASLRWSNGYRAADNNDLSLRRIPQPSVNLRKHSLPLAN